MSAEPEGERVPEPTEDQPQPPLPEPPKQAIAVGGTGKSVNSTGSHSRATINGTSNRLQIEGNCDEIIASGTDHHVAIIGASDNCFVSGERNKIDIAGHCTKCSVTSSNNRIEIGENCDFKMNGRYNEMIVEGECNNCYIGGMFNFADVSTAEGCKYSINGSENRLMVYGTCGDMNIGGISNICNIVQGCKTLTIKGVQSRVMVKGDCESITLSGLGQFVTIIGNVQSIKVDGSMDFKRAADSDENEGSGSSNPKIPNSDSNSSNEIPPADDGDVESSDDESGSNDESGDGDIIENSINTEATEEAVSGSGFLGLIVTSITSFLTGGRFPKKPEHNGSAVATGPTPSVESGANIPRFTTTNTNNVNANGTRRNTIRITGNVGNIEVIQKKTWEAGLNTITVDGSCTGTVSIIGTSNSVTVGESVKKVKVDGERNILRCKSCSDKKPGEFVHVVKEEEYVEDEKSMKNFIILNKEEAESS